MILLLQLAASILFFIHLPDSGGGPTWLPMDKLAHFGFHAFFTWGHVKYSKWRSSRVVLAMFIYGLLIESGQALTSYRSAELGDVLANVLGSLFIMGLLKLADRRHKI